MNRKTAKIIVLILLSICLLFIMYSPVLASGTSLTGDQIQADAKTWLSTGASQNKINPHKVAAVLRPVANILLAIGSVLIVIVAVVMGIKYVSSTPDQKGQLKKQLIGLFVSAVILYGAYGIWALVYSILKTTIG